MVNESPLRFDWPDYLIFALTLVSSLLIGIYHAWKGAGKSTTNYLLGGKTMSIFPIAMSLASSTVSTNTMMGMPTDVYLNGSMMMWLPIAIVMSKPFEALVTIPLLQGLGVLSVNQYLELRFHRLVRRIYAGLGIFGMLLYLSMVTYAPSLALAQVTGLHVYVCATITFAVCTFYTTIGGMKAVVWSDTLQIFLMMGSVIALVIKGTVDVGIGNVWERNLNSSRIEFFNIDPNPTTQKTIWAMLIGGSLGGIVTDQGTYQRFLSVPTRRHGQIAIAISVVVIGTFMILCCSTGLLAHAKYFDCDPYKAKIITKADQILPYYVMDTLGGIPGMPGLFIAGIFSAALSTLSTVLNGVSLTMLEDFVRPCFPNLTDVASTRISKCIAFIVGLTAYALVYLVSNVETILETNWTISGAGGGMAVGIFTLGMLVPWANTIGATVGMLTSYGLILTLGIFTQAAKSQGLLPNKQAKPLNTYNCPSSNGTLFEAYVQEEEKSGFNLLAVSFIWYTFMGTFITITVGTLVSFLTRHQNIDELNPKLIFPCVRRWVGKRYSPPKEVEADKDKGRHNNAFVEDHSETHF